MRTKKSDRVSSSVSVRKKIASDPSKKAVEIKSKLKKSVKRPSSCEESNGSESDDHSTAGQMQREVSPPGGQSVALAVKDLIHASRIQDQRSNWQTR